MTDTGQSHGLAILVPVSVSYQQQMYSVHVVCTIIRLDSCFILISPISYGHTILLFRRTDDHLRSANQHVWPSPTCGRPGASSADWLVSCQPGARLSPSWQTPPLLSHTLPRFDVSTTSSLILHGPARAPGRAEFLLKTLVCRHISYFSSLPPAPTAVSLCLAVVLIVLPCPHPTPAAHVGYA